MSDRVNKRISIKMTDKEYKKLKDKAEQVGFKSVGELFSAFIGDLTNSQYTHGSDERRLADEWFYRMSQNY